MNRFRVLIADDEPLAREMLQAMVEPDPELEVVGVVASGREAAERIARERPDIVLIDIQMPEIDGLEAMRRMNETKPVFVFVTAHDQYAAQAFEIEALDYVLKPFSEARLGQALARAKRRVREKGVTEVASQLATLTAELCVEGGEAKPDATGQRRYLTRLPIGSRGRTRFVPVDDILWVESQDYCVQIHTSQIQPIVRTTLKSLAERLDPARFCLVRRGALVNVDAIDEVQTLFKGTHAIRLCDGTELRVSRSRWQQVRDLVAPKYPRS